MHHEHCFVDNELTLFENANNTQCVQGRQDRIGRLGIHSTF